SLNGRFETHETGRRRTCRSGKSYPRGFAHEGESAHHPARCSLGAFVANLFGSRRQLEVENLFLRHQLNVVLRDPPHRLRLRGSDRALLVWMTWLWPTRASFSLTRSCAGIAQGFGPITRSARKAQS